jgi:hypothetical protein
MPPDTTWQILIIPLLAALAATVFILYVWKRLKALTTATTSVAPADLDGRVKCPRCGRLMTAGFVVTPRGIIWRDTVQAPPGIVAAPWNVLENTLSMKMRPERNQAWRCEPCRVLTIDYSVLIS